MPTKLKRLLIDRVDLVDKGANPEAHIVLFKRDGSESRGGVSKARWTQAYINDLPDSAFAVIEPGGVKDEEGKTTPRSLRHLPYKDAEGNIDIPHLRNALARLPQTDISDELKEKARRRLEAAAKEVGVEVSEKRSALDALKKRIARLFKEHGGFVEIGDAIENADTQSVMQVVDEVEECAKAWREQLEKGESNMLEMSTKTVDLDALLKGVSEEAKAAIKDAFAKHEQELADLRKQVEELSERGDGDKKPDDINKADLPEPVRKRLEDLEKRAKEAEEIAKAEREARVRAEIRKRAEGYANVGEVEKIAEAIYKAQSVSAEFAEQLETLFKSAHERIEKGDLFKEFGSGTGDSASTAWGKIEAAAAEIMKANPSMTRPQAIAKALEANPELEKAYFEEVRR